MEKGKKKPESSIWLKMPSADSATNAQALPPSSEQEAKSLMQMNEQDRAQAFKGIRNAFGAKPPKVMQVAPPVPEPSGDVLRKSVTDYAKSKTKKD